MTSALQHPGFAPVSFSLCLSVFSGVAAVSHGLGVRSLSIINHFINNVTHLISAVFEKDCTARD